ncbi:MAG: hypothetical protein PHI19_07475 [Clostridia bacterium]|nr:hypothetical protein [Clostridia bacterium]
MKKTIMIAISIALIGVMAIGLSACNLRDPFTKTEKAFAEAVEVCDSLDDPHESDLSAANVQTNFVQSEESDIVLLSATVEEVGILDNAEKIQQALDYLANIRTRQTELNGSRASVKVEISTFKTGVKSFREQGLTLTEEEKQLLEDYVAEIKELREAIKGTIGKVYVKLKDTRGLYRVSIDAALDNLASVSAQMDIRLNSAGRLYEIATEINTILDAKINPATEE